MLWALHGIVNVSPVDGLWRLANSTAGLSFLSGTSEDDGWLALHAYSKSVDYQM
jgi:hypothetical protein